MSSFDVSTWSNMIKKIYQNELSYLMHIEEELYSDLDLKESIDKLNDTINKYIKGKHKDIDTNSLKSIFESISQLDDETTDLRKVISLVTDLHLIKSIQRSMSETYYNNILAENKALLKEMDKLDKNINDYINQIMNEMSLSLTDQYTMKEIDSLYTSNMSDNTTKLFLKLLKMYKDKGKDIKDIVETIKDISLGYNGERFSLHPFCDHPLLLMGITFNLYAHQSTTFIPKEDLVSRNEPMVLVDNSLKHATNEIIYILNKILFGEYRDIYRNHSINQRSIEASQSIVMRLINVGKNTGIEELHTKSGEEIDIYESLDGKKYRKMLPTLATTLAENLKIGPKPRVYLYNTQCEGVLINKKEIFLTKTPQGGTKYIDVSHMKNTRNISDVMKAMGTEKEKSGEKYLYGIILADKVLKEIKRLKRKKDIKEWKIPLENYLVGELL